MIARSPNNSEVRATIETCQRSSMPRGDGVITPPHGLPGKGAQSPAVNFFSRTCIRDE